MAGSPAERGEDVFVECYDYLPGGREEFGALVGEGEPDSPGVVGVVAAFDESGLFQRSSKLGHIHRFEAGEVGELALGGGCPAAGQSLQSCQQPVLGVGQSQWGERSVERSPAPQRHLPDQPSGRGHLPTVKIHTDILNTETIMLATICSGWSPMDHVTGSRSQIRIEATSMVPWPGGYWIGRAGRDGRRD